MLSVTHSEASGPTPKLSEGQQVGGCFLLSRPIGDARGGSIWLAQDEVLGKEISLHFLPLAVARDARAVTELRQEVKRSRQLIHPNILRVYDLVEDGETLAIAMDRFEGESLAKYGSAGGAEADELLRWIKQLGETLGDAHRIQLFHRDLAPENIYLRPNGSVLISGFGVSRVIGESLERARAATSDVAHLAYMSPQQIDGERPSAADDVYGMGVLAYELLTGQPPFTGDNLVASIRKVSARPVNEARKAAGRPPVSAPWERFVTACMAKTVEERPKSCAEALSILADAHKSGSPVAATVVPAAAKVAPAVSVPAVKPPSEVRAPEPPKTSISTVAAKKPASGVAALIPPLPVTPSKPKPAPLSSSFPDLDRPKSKLPLIGLGVAASVLAAALYFKSETNLHTGVGSAVSRVEDTSAGDGTELVESVAPIPDQTLAPRFAAANLLPAPERDGIIELAKNDPQPEPESEPAGKKPGRELIGANPKKEGKKPADAAAGTAPVTPADAKLAEPALAEAAPDAKKTGGIAAIPLPPTPPPLPKISIPAGANAEQISGMLAERQTATTKFAEAAAAAERVRLANAQLREIRQEDLDAQKKSLEEKRKTLNPVIKAASDLEAERKKLEENMAKAEAAAKESARVAEAARKSFEDLMATSGDKAAAKQKAEAELSASTSVVTDGTKQVEELSQSATRAEAQRQQMILAERQAEQEIQLLTTALEKATKSQRDAMLKANRPKIAALEAQVKEVDEQLERYQKAVSSLQALNDESTKDAIARIQEKIATATTQRGEYQLEVRKLSGTAPVAPKPVSPAAAPAAPAPPAATPPAGAAMKPPASTPPAPTPAVTKTAPPLDVVGSAPALPELPAKGAATPSTAAKFVPVGDVQFATHLVTRAEFEAFSKATNLKPEHWRNPGFEQSPAHPVVNVTWKEADAFCKWLTEKDRKSGSLMAGEHYRLPSDTEWSKAVGLPAESGATPEDRDMRVDDVYPWGTQWPPPAGAGNFAGEETVTELPIEGYNDKFPNTSPVGSFTANAAGLYDMGGNVWQWVHDSFDGTDNAKTLRGGSWYNGAIKMSLLSSCRIKSSPETINDTYGFRIVKAAKR